MIPELIKAHCSMVGAWGNAITNTTGSIYQLRALDWSTNGPFQKFPQVTVYHPTDDDGHSFAVLTWTGFIGAITGYSSSSVGLGDNTINQFRAVEYSHDYVRVGDDKNFPEWNYHPSMSNVVYIDKHKQPSSDPCLGSLLEQHYANIDCVT